MTRKFVATLTLTLACTAGATPCRAEDSTASKTQTDAAQKAEDKKPDAKQGDPKKAQAEADDPQTSVTTGSVIVDGVEVPYVATAGKLVQKDDSGDEKASVFYVAYTRGGLDADGAAEADPRRPITFCFNGGPGSSSVWLHLGMLGPQRIRMPDDASSPRPPFGLEANPHSLLDTTDLVFIDPVGTGYSRVAEGEKTADFWGLEEDLRSVSQFVHDYTTQNRRWSSPKFVLGESYGGLRAGGLAARLQERYRMYLSGVVLVSAVLDFSTLSFTGNNDLSPILFLPAYTATAWRHRALSDDLLAMPVEEVVARAEEFAYGPYADALLRGAALPADERASVVAEAARLTGLSAEYVERADLRVPQWRFSKELLRGRNQIVGRFDSRYVGPSDDPNAESMDYDPSDAAFEGVFGGAMNVYLAETLKYSDDRVYEVLTSVQPWNYKPFVNRYVTTADRLASAMTANPSLRVFAACGRFDLATPAFAMKHTRDHALRRADVRSRFTLREYDGGHMMYVYGPSLEKLRSDLVGWYAEALR